MVAGRLRLGEIKLQGLRVYIWVIILICVLISTKRSSTLSWPHTSASWVVCLGQYFSSLLDVRETEKSVVALHLPTGPLETH